MFALPCLYLLAFAPIIYGWFVREMPRLSLENRDELVCPHEAGVLRPFLFRQLARDRVS